MSKKKSAVMVDVIEVRSAGTHSHDSDDGHLQRETMTTTCNMLPAERTIQVLWLAARRRSARCRRLSRIYCSVPSSCLLAPCHERLRLKTTRSVVDRGGHRLSHDRCGESQAERLHLRRGAACCTPL
jgi:hypothetical protein